jgi:hypothetical protein
VAANAVWALKSIVLVHTKSSFGVPVTAIERADFCLPSTAPARWRSTARRTGGGEGVVADRDDTDR